jgi:hypothetical protein
VGRLRRLRALCPWGSRWSRRQLHGRPHHPPRGRGAAGPGGRAGARGPRAAHRAAGSSRPVGHRDVRVVCRVGSGPGGHGAPPQHALRRRSGARHPAAVLRRPHPRTGRSCCSTARRTAWCRCAPLVASRQPTRPGASRSPPMSDTCRSSRCPGGRPTTSWTGSRARGGRHPRRPPLTTGNVMASAVAWWRAPARRGGRSPRHTARARCRA